MHVMPRRCKLLLKPYFLFGKKRQKQDCTNHWRTSYSFKKKKKLVYTKRCAIIFAVVKVYHFCFLKSRTTNKCLIMCLDTEFNRTVLCGCAQTYPSLRHAHRLFHAPWKRPWSQREPDLALL